MIIQKFIDYLKTLEELEVQDIERIKQVVKWKRCQKKELLVSNKQVCDKVFFVVNGLLRTYNINNFGIEKTRLISTEKMFCSNWASFSNLTKNNEFIQSLEDSEVIYIEQKDFYELINSSQILKKIYIKILEEFQIYHIRRLEFLTTLTNVEKLAYFDDYFPNIYNRISNKVLASFLSISEENCSRLKNKKLNN